MFYLEKKSPDPVCLQIKEEHQMEVDLTKGSQVPNIKPTL